MAVTPGQLFQLAVTRHRQPWNWTLHCAGMVLFGAALFAHSYLTLASSLILLGTGFFELKMEPPPDNRWFRFVHRSTEWERNWAATPWNFAKSFKFALALLLGAILIWALIIQELAVLAFFAGMVALARVVAENRDCGIDP